MRILLRILLISALIVGGCADDQPREPALVNGVPHVVLLTLDTLRPSHTTPYGYARHTTPNLAAFARTSVQFDRAYASMPTTGPSHITMLTGLYPQEHGALRNGVGVSAGLDSLPKRMQRSGRRTAAFVSVHHLSGETIGLDGFEVWDAPPRVRDGAKTLDVAMKWVVRHRAEPFFLWVHLFDAHAPYEAHEGLTEEIAQALAPLTDVSTREHVGFLDTPMSKAEARKLELLYDADIYYTDQLVGTFLDFLDTVGVASHAMIAIASDHGEILSEAMGRWSYAFDHGELLWPGEIRTALWVRVPGGPAGVVEQRVVETRALFGSLLWAAGLPVRDSVPKLPGFGAESMGDNDAAERTAFITRRTVRGRKIPAALKGTRVGLVRGNVLAIRRGQESQPTLFNLERPASIPPEMTHQAPGLVSRYAELLDHWQRNLATNGSPRPEPRISREMQDHLRALGYVQ